MDIERRRFRRISAALSKEKTVHIGVGEEAYAAELLNLSRVGALLDVASDQGDAIPAGGTVSLFFQRGGHVFKLPATVARKEGSLLACDFSNLSASDEAELKAKMLLLEILAVRLEA